MDGAFCRFGLSTGELPLTEARFFVPSPSKSKTSRKDMELLIIILILLLVAVVAGLGLLLYQTISRRNIAMQQMAQTVHDLVERLPDEEDTKRKNKYLNHKNKSKSYGEKNV